MNHKLQTENKQHREEANVKRAILLAAAMMAASVPALAETMRIGDQAVVKKCKEYITLREADNVQATELA